MYTSLHNCTNCTQLYTTLQTNLRNSTNSLFFYKIHNFATFYKQLSQIHKYFTAHDKQKPYTTLHIFTNIYNTLQKQTIQHNFTKPSKITSKLYKSWITNFKTLWIFKKNTQHYTSLQNTQLHKTLQSHTKHYKQIQ